MVCTAHYRNLLIKTGHTYIWVSGCRIHIRFRGINQNLPKPQSTSQRMGWHYSSAMLICLVFIQFAKWFKLTFHAPHIEHPFMTRYVAAHQLTQTFNLQQWIYRTGIFQSRRLHLVTGTFLWPEQHCWILCIFCYFRFALGCPALSWTL